MRTFNKNRIFGLPMLFALLIATVSTLSAQKPDNIEREKLQAIEDFRLLFSKSGYRTFQLTKKRTEQIKPQKCIELLQDDGKFSDLVVEQKAIELEKSYLSKQKSQQVKVGNFIEVAYNRIWRIAKLYKGKEVDFQDELIIRLCKAINNYSAIEAARGSITNGRFHTSCFAIPTAAVNTYFCLFQGMEAVENEQETSDWAIKANQSLLDMSYQSWTQPYRKDETDDNPVSVDRFRNHVWWVGGNGLGFRSLIPTAAAMKSIEMMDVLATVAKGGLSNVSQSTVDEAFWTEGFTADGAGWGHGMQNLIWGYPISGTSAALNLIEYFKGTPWAESLEEENAQALINYFRGSSWHYYKGYTPRCLDRGSMAYDELKSEKIKTAKMINTALDSWSASYSAEEQRELRDLKEDIKDKQVEMQGYQPGYYTGTRWFFNNDNLIRKNPDYYNFISMASVRCDGIEMAHNLADRYNFFTCDGATFFMKQGNEYHQAIGAWNLTAIPGVTARQGEDKLIPITNWRGYCSKHNFAAAATSSGKNAAAGFIFEKMNASAKKNVNDKAGLNDPNEIIYGVKVHKGYFMVDDYLIALGAGVTNLQPELDGEIWTTIDQTYYQGNTIEYFSSGSVQEGRQINLQLEDKDLVWAAQEGGFAYAVLP
ncbi:MAG: polysaccharide lyase family 8 super-sandwich domain-containing protein, partial [Bacteroidota bacterium]